MSAPLLSVSLITYNHVAFIREAIESVLMQKVDFSWELIIADDFSTDGTRSILLEYKDRYPEFITLILQEKNVGAGQNWIDLMNASRGEYIAYFEGDDYWTDREKLQKQIDFLEKNKSYSFCFHDSLILNQKTQTSHARIGQRIIDDNPDLKSVIIENNISSASIVFRNIVPPSQWPEWIMTSAKGDYGLIILLAEKGRGKYFTDIMSVYRIHDQGIWSGKNATYFLKQNILFFESLDTYFNNPEITQATYNKIKFIKFNHAVTELRAGKVFLPLVSVIRNYFISSDKRIQPSLRKAVRALVRRS